MSLLAIKNHAAGFLLVALTRSLGAILLSVFPVLLALAQEDSSPHAGAVTPLSELLAEAERNNPQIEAARQGWQAAKQVPTQVSTLPDPQFTLQHLSVGSPRPFAGYTNSDFAYLGLGVSQDIPYPGKLRLKGEIAKREADASHYLAGKRFRDRRSLAHTPGQSGTPRRERISERGLAHRNPRRRSAEYRCALPRRVGERRALSADKS